MSNLVSVDRGFSCQRAIAVLRSGPLAGTWLFAWVFLAQVGHLVEHIAKQLSGSGLLGPTFDSELSHLIFNATIALLSVLLVAVYPRNLWVYPLMILSVFHGIEHVYIFNEFMKAGTSDGPGLLGQGGALGLIPLDRLDLHNIYNGLEVVILTGGFWQEVDTMLAGKGESLESDL